MNIPKLTSAHLQLLLDLTRRKEAIEADLEQLEQQITDLYANNGNGDAAPVKATTPRRGRPPGKKTKAKPVAATRKTRKRARRGALKEMVLEALKAAGGEGMAVGEIADKIGAKKTAVNVWFYTTGKKVAGLKKVAPGRFAFKG